ncbi:MAG: cyclic nucleotide-binding domain-containing protein [Bacteroidota bacterium]
MDNQHSSLIEVRTDLDPNEVLQRLSQIDILRALPPEEVQEIVPFVEYVTYPAGTIVMKEGEKGDALYFIEDGKAHVTRSVDPAVITVGTGNVVGEVALLTGEPRSATVTAATDLSIWRVKKAAFDQLVASSPNLKRALELLVEHRKKGTAPVLPSPRVWVSTALRAIDAQSRGLKPWQLVMGIGLGLWVLVSFNELRPLIDVQQYFLPLALAQLISGLLIIQGACEAFIQGVERLGARLRWDGFISGTIGSVLGTLPEFFVIAFLVQVEPLAGIVTAIVTIFNNALAFSVYSFFLPKDPEGAYTMPRSLTSAGGELLIAGGAITLIVGIVMLVLSLEGSRSSLEGLDLVGIGIILMAIYGYYLLTLMRYYGEGKDDRESIPPDPERLGHDVSGRGIFSMMILGVIGAYAGGEAVGGFAEIALKGLGLPTIPTAAFLAFFAGMSEYVIVYKSHRRGELGIALSNVFGGLSQVMFLLLPFALIVIGILGLLLEGSKYVLPINVVTTLLMLLLFPLFYALHQYIQQEKKLSNLDAAAMTGIYLLLLYFLFTSPS